eukprot:649975-Prorocentrum_minimum.AAC.3
MRETETRHTSPLRAMLRTRTGTFSRRAAHRDADRFAPGCAKRHAAALNCVRYAPGSLLKRGAQVSFPPPDT